MTQVRSYKIRSEGAPNYFVISLSSWSTKRHGRCSVECILLTTCSCKRNSAINAISHFVHERIADQGHSIKHVTIITFRHENSSLFFIKVNLFIVSHTTNRSVPSINTRACCRLIRNVSDDNNNASACNMQLERLQCNVMWLKYRLLHHKYLVVIILYANLDDVMHKITCSLQHLFTPCPMTPMSSQLVVNWWW